MISRITVFFSVLVLCASLHAQQPLRRVFQPPSVVNKIPYGANAEAGHYVKSNDANVYYEVYGKGQPILIMHGGALGSTIEMADFVENLKSEYQVIAMSLRGHGKSELGHEPLTLSQRANDAMAVINAVTKDSVIVLGFSDGGYSSYQLAALYPNRIKKMIVIGAGEIYPGLREFNLTAKQAIEMDKAYWDQQMKLMSEPNRVQDLLTQIANCYNNVTVGKELLGEIKCPVLVMAGDRDQGNPVERVVSAARYIAKHQISIIPNGSHVVFLENFDAVWASIIPFLKN